MKAIINGKIFKDDKFIEDKVLIFSEKIIDLVSYDDYKKINISQVFDAENNFVLPGFIDQHTHGYNGYDVMDKDEKSLLEIKKSLLKNGVTSFLPTTVTASKENLENMLKNVRNIMKNQSEGAKVVGVHLEGPYINPIFKGAQNGDFITEPDFDFIEEYKDVLKIITVAPEIDGVLDLIKKYRDDINFQMGHTNATYQQALDGIKAGIKGATHTFNAMTPIHHRDMGVAGASLSSECYAEFICDKVHITPSLYSFIAKNKGLEKMLLITDCISAGGLGDGEYSLGGLKVIVKDGVCKLENGVIAGSTLKLNNGLKNFVENSNITLEECIKTVTANQATYLNLKDVGFIEKGYCSDLVIMDKEFNVKNTFVDGKEYLF